MPLALVAPSLDRLDGYAAALGTGWSPNNVRDVSAEQLAAIEQDPEGFVASLTSRTGTIVLPSGRSVPKLPFILRWLWDGEFCGSITLRWQDGTDDLPDHVLGHIGYAVVPAKRRLGYASEALRLIMPEARALGLNQVEVTCDPDNGVSRRVIEKNGGVLIEKFDARDYLKTELRFVIDLRRILVTPRLLLTPIDEADFADLAALNADPEVGGRLKHGVLTEAQTRAQFDGYRAIWAERGFGVFALRLRETGAFVGIAGLWDHDGGLGTALRYAVMPEHRGTGLAREAATGILNFAKRQNIHPIIAATRENNIASQRILTDLGFTLRDISGEPGHRVMVFELAGKPA
jgi:predicted acetyltransferase